MKTKIIVLKLRPELLRSIPATPTHVRIEKKKPGKKKQAALALSAASSSVPSTPSGNHGPGESSTPKSKSGANAGNVGIKELDRSGKPCRRWVKGTAEITSFTGFKYAVCSWTSSN